MYSLFATAFQKFRNRPLARFDARRHCRGASNRQVRFAEIIVREVQGNRSNKIFELFGKGVREARQPAAAKANGVTSKHSTFDSKGKPNVESLDVRPISDPFRSPCKTVEWANERVNGCVRARPVGPFRRRGRFLSFSTQQNSCQPEILYATLFHFFSHFSLHSLITYAIMRGVRYGHAVSGAAFG